MKNIVIKRILKGLLAVIVIIGAYILIYNLINSYDSSSSKTKVFDSTDTTNRFYISENNYAASVKSVVEPYINGFVRNGTFNNGGHTIAYNMYLLDSPRANVVISHGYTERKEKFQEVAYYFLKMGYQVFVLDHYSHGTSSRSTTDSSLAHIDNYNVFCDDLNKFIATVVKEHSKGVKTILFGHSMGGAIAARAVEEHPEIVDALILNAPLMKIGTPNRPPDFAADPVSKLMILFGKGADYALGQRGYEPSSDKDYNPSNPATFCVARGKYWHDYILSLTQHPTNGVSWKLASAFFSMTHDVVKKKNVQNIKVPILLFQAERDGYVDPKGHYEFANNANNIDFYLVKGAGHEIYIETDKIIVPYFNKIHQFIEQVLKGESKQ